MRGKAFLRALAGTALLALASVYAVSSVSAQTVPYSLRSDIVVRKVMSTQASSPSVRLARDPRNNALYYVKRNGDVYRMNISGGTSQRVWTSASHGLTEVQGMAIDDAGTMYLSGNADYSSTRTFATIMKGVLTPSGTWRTWSVLAKTASYPKSNSSFDHRVNALAVSADGKTLYINSGSRTDHGEVEDTGGVYPRLRETGLTACILQVPTDGNNILLKNNRTWLKENGYLFAEGTRNTFDMALAPNGDLFATENSPTDDASDELNWLQEGAHYGFPWRFGGVDNPQQFNDYDPSADNLLNPESTYVGLWTNDPRFPVKPAVVMTEPIRNVGPDADKFRDPLDGSIKEASVTGAGIRTFTAHRSPLGLVFDRAQVLSPEFRGHGFMLSWSKGDPLGDSPDRPFEDASQDLLHLILTKTGDTYTVQATRIVVDFNNPIDSELIGNKLYVLEYGGTQGLWEITLPKS